MNIERKYITVDGIHIEYFDYGEGMPLVCLHGFASYSITWHDLSKRLQGEYRIIAFDLKGFGFSDKPNDEKYRATDQAYLLIKCMKALDLPECAIVGHSYGGLIALLMLLSGKLSVKVSRLILIASVGYYSKIPEFIIPLKVPLMNKLLLEKANLQLLSRVILKHVFYNHNKIPEKLVQAYANVLHNNTAKRSLIKSAKYFTHQSSKCASSRFSLVSVSTLILWGVDDALIPVQDSYKFKNAIPNSSLIVIPECGHSPQEECPQIVTSHIRQFMQSK